MLSNLNQTKMGDATQVPNFDVIVIGAGFAGLYALYRMRDHLGLTVRAYDSAGGVGGTWYWNRYPGARCDIESIHYSYSFSEKLQQEWEWTERYASQPEILAYLNHVADRFDLRRDIQFNTRVASMVWDEEAHQWQVGFDDGNTARARWVISATGPLTAAPHVPDFAGMNKFSGEVYMTARWPHQDVDLKGKRVAVIGTGPSGIQVIQEIAKDAAYLTVFQRTADYATPLGNGPLVPSELASVKKRYSKIREAARNHFLGIPPI
ncbi:flavin-containing monooxygenase [Paenibacillus medicaginis]|uniref:Flavin-containing monooxygenase n=1 Tax=Paenibacillus medicaginis TaxID=1470560 RepID=A0ABV5BVA0_9BACL